MCSLWEILKRKSSHLILVTLDNTSASVFQYFKNGLNAYQGFKNKKNSPFKKVYGNLTIDLTHWTSCQNNQWLKLTTRFELYLKYNVTINSYEINKNLKLKKNVNTFFKKLDSWMPNWEQVEDTFLLSVRARSRTCKK